MNKIRKLALAVDEPELGEFYWIILECKDDAIAWEELSSGMHGYATWREAWSFGIIEYSKMVKDQRIGPRCVIETETL
jgi:hypothetical protein